MAFLVRHLYIVSERISDATNRCLRDNQQLCQCWWRQLHRLLPWNTQQRAMLHQSRLLRQPKRLLVDLPRLQGRNVLDRSVPRTCRLQVLPLELREFRKWIDMESSDRVSWCFISLRKVFYQNVVGNTYNHTYSKSLAQFTPGYSKVVHQ